MNPFGDGTSARWGESVEDAMGDWVQSNGCASAPTSVVTTGAADVRTWPSGCRDGAEAQLHVVPGGTHTFHLPPSTTATLFDFFARL